MGCITRLLSAAWRTLARDGDYANPSAGMRPFSGVT